MIAKVFDEEYEGPVIRFKLKSHFSSEILIEAWSENSEYICDVLCIKNNGLHIIRQKGHLLERFLTSGIPQTDGRINIIFQ